jgi:hypothetical protein
MAKPALSIPVSLMVIVVGVLLMYYVLHGHGWSLSGGVPLAAVFRGLSMVSRTLVVGGLIITAWGTGALLNGIAQQK